MPVVTSRDRYSEDMLLTSAARTTSGDSGTHTGYGGASSLRAQLDVTSVAGVTPTLDVVLEDTLDGTNWNTIGTFAQKTAAGREVINITTPFAERLRVRYTIGGGASASFTFSMILLAQAPTS